MISDSLDRLWLHAEGLSFKESSAVDLEGHGEWLGVKLQAGGKAVESTTDKSVELQLYGAGGLSFGVATPSFLPTIEAGLGASAKASAFAKLSALDITEIPVIGEIFDSIFGDIFPNEVPVPLPELGSRFCFVIPKITLGVRLIPFVDDRECAEVLVIVNPFDDDILKISFVASAKAHIGIPDFGQLIVRFIPLIQVRPGVQKIYTVSIDRHFFLSDILR